MFILIIINIIFFIFCQPVSATIPDSFYPAMSIIDSSWNLNYTNNYGPANLACNCSNNSSGGFFPCLWNNNGYGFFCTNGNLTSLMFEQLPIVAATIPSEVNLLNSLTTLNLININLIGNLPNLSNLTSLVNFNLYNNSLTGDLNDNLDSLVNINYLYLANNNFTGSTSWLNNLTKLIDLDLANNQFSGVLTLNFTTLYLQQLLLNNNNFIGPVPSSIVNNYFNNINFCNLSLNNFDQCNDSGGILAININCLVGCHPSTNNCLVSTPIANSICYNGQWQVIGDVTNDDQIIINSTTIISGNYNQNSNSTLVINNGVLIILGTATLDGTLVIELNNNSIGLVPIINASIIIGNFTSINITNNNKCLSHTIVQTSNSISVLLLNNDNCNKTKNKKSYTIIVITVVSVVVFVTIVVIIIYLIFTYGNKFIPLFGYVKEDNYFR